MNRAVCFFNGNRICVNKPFRVEGIRQAQAMAALPWVVGQFDVEAALRRHVVRHLADKLAATIPKLTHYLPLRQFDPGICSVQIMKRAFLSLVKFLTI